MKKFLDEVPDTVFRKSRDGGKWLTPVEFLIGSSPIWKLPRIVSVCIIRNVSVFIVMLSRIKKIDRVYRQLSIITLTLLLHHALSHQALSQCIYLFIILASLTIYDWYEQNVDNKVVKVCICFLTAGMYFRNTPGIGKLTFVLASLYMHNSYYQWRFIEREDSIMRLYIYIAR